VFLVGGDFYTVIVVPAIVYAVGEEADEDASDSQLISAVMFQRS
jgi:hypothetical protein